MTKRPLPCPSCRRRAGGTIDILDFTVLHEDIYLGMVLSILWLLSLYVWGRYYAK